MNKEHFKMVRDCEERESMLSEDDIIFIAEMGDILESGKSLTHDQAEKLDEIWGNSITPFNDNPNSKVKGAIGELVLLRASMDSTIEALNDIGTVAEASRHAVELSGTAEMIDDWIKGLEDEL